MFTTCFTSYDALNDLGLHFGHSVAEFGRQQRVADHLADFVYLIAMYRAWSLKMYEASVGVGNALPGVGFRILCLGNRVL